MKKQQWDFLEAPSGTAKYTRSEYSCNDLPNGMRQLKDLMIAEDIVT
jgi:hypothetical protein